ncbi:hypothetical protein ACF0H5_008797 [Mactra antiquata]
MVFLSELQELCPYASFCGENARFISHENGTKQSCCRSCSCEPECVMFGNCCFDYVSDGQNTQLRQCLSPMVMNVRDKEINYIMVYSCPTRDGKDSVCTFNTTDVKSFAPVVSIKTGEIYVNSQCAHCNNVTDGVPWELAVACPSSGEDYLVTSADMFIEANGDATCYLTYVPPERVNVESRECKKNVVRQCNVTGLVTKWSMYWEYCPMFNATFYAHSYAFGNVFCYLCNELRMNDLFCRKNNIKGLNSFPFIVMLEEIHFADVTDSGKNDRSINSKHNMTFLFDLQELCPYTSFCGDKARLTLQENETKQSCCKTCSCEPECERFGNCCFDYISDGPKTQLRQCLSPIVTYGKQYVMNHLMVYSCLIDGKESVCHFNTTDVQSFDSVVAIKTGEIYVNPQGAHCNNVTDGLPWELAVTCPFSDEDYLITLADIFFGRKSRCTMLSNIHSTRTCEC